MKRILLYSMLLLSAVAGAQIVEIPDPAFKAKLLFASTSNFHAKDINGDPMNIDVNNDDEIQAEEALAVYELSVNGSGIQDITGILAFQNLTSLKMNFNAITSADLAGMANLETLDLSTNMLEEINLTGCISLNHAYLQSNELVSIDLNQVPDLEWLFCAGNNLEVLDLTPVNLTNLNCGNNNFEILDITSQTQLNQFYVESSDVLTTVFMKNGNVDPVIYDTFYYCPNLTYICADDDEIDLIYNALLEITPPVTNVPVNAFCTGVPGGDYNTISGVLSFDSDGNGCSGTEGLNTYVRLDITDGTDNNSTTTDLLGAYDLYTGTGSFTITPEFENDWFIATPSSVSVVLDTEGNFAEQNFCITPNGFHPDLEVLVVTMEAAQPGFDAVYKLIYRNKGNQSLSGSVYFAYDDSVLDYVSAIPAEDNNSGGLLSWEFDLMPFEGGYAVITVNVNSPMESPAVNIGDVLEFYVSATPVAGDETLTDNEVNYFETVVGSYDPNDKTCLEGVAVLSEMIGEYLHYNINFENTGTAPATFIVVKDVINPAQFDINTLQVLNASHEMTVKVEGNTVEFRFDDIDLGPLEKGNVLFKVKTLNTLQVGDEVSNFADIFFDYNFPITTNDATTSFEVLGTGDFKVDSSVTIYPNPTNGLVNIAADSNLTSLQLYDLQGRLLQTVLPNDAYAILDMASRATGVYLLKVTSEKGMKVERIVNE